MKNKNVYDPHQFSLFDSLPDELAGKLDDLSSDDWLAVMEEVQEKYKGRKAQEQAEQERIRQNEQAKRERLRLEEEQRRRDIAQRLHDQHVAEVTCMDLPMDWNNLYADDERTAGIHAESISDGLILSLTNLGAVDIEYIAKVSKYSYKEVISTLKGSIFQNPARWDECFYKGWETSDDYLSGNLIRKHKVAKKANKTYNGYFSDNLKAIEAVLPEPVRADEIYVTLGSPWVPASLIDDFINHLLGELSHYISHYNNSDGLTTVNYEPITCSWDIPYKNRYGNKIKAVRTYGTNRMSALHIIEKTLNMKTLQIFDKVPSQTTSSGEKRELNKIETIAVQEKQQLIIEEFRKWIWNDKLRKEWLEEIYDSKFGCVRRRIFNGAYLSIPGLSSDVTLYPYQKNAVARILFTPNTLLAHEVGAGKTYVMIAAGMELRRMGISRKNVYVVPNNIVGQWKDIYLLMYPHANLFIVEPDTFTQKKRQSVLRCIRDDDYDAIIIAYSCFELIPMSRAHYIHELEEEMLAVDNALKKPVTNQPLENRRTRLNDKIVNARYRWISSSVYFDELGINTLFVDEAHNFKNISIETSISKVLGISKSGSSKCNEMLHKVRSVQRANNGRGVVFATGTPITNSVTDLFVMQTYLQYGELRFLDLHHFDNWAATFGEKVTEFEVDVDTSSYRMATRFSKFHNLPELTNLLTQIADFYRVGKTNDIPDFEGYDDKIVSKTTELTDYLIDISARAESIRNGRVSRTEDNMLKLTTDGRKAALDMRLAEPNTTFSYDCKVFRCMENVLNTYKETSDRHLTQLIFCDMSTPKAEFNVYDELKDLLVYYGVQENEIDFVHNYKTEKQRSQLFAKMQSGEVRILLGSTFKLGMGVNVQKKLVAIHHLDVPWRPSDMIQREGRILRQGNENKSVQIFRYITDGSFDAYSWQLLESKQRFICQLLSGSVTERSASDVDDVVLNYAEIKALAIGNPLIKLRVETSNELKRTCALQQKLIQAHFAMKQELLEIPGKTEHIKSLIKNAGMDLEHYLAKRIEIKELKGHRQFGADILNALKEHIMQKDEKTLFEYQGFNIVLPDYMTELKPYVWIEGSGRYYTEVGDSDIGCINRIDNKLNGLPKFIEEQEFSLQKLAERKADIESELAKPHSYASEIEVLKNRLAKIDIELGVES
ncbi:MAG: SNF2-related protein [Oscillospiraceae bacterium]|nr:SNF2-related protein [Oscillospiraceae bacterium]